MIPEKTTPKPLLPPEDQSEERGRKVALFALLPAALASTCCLGPLLFILFGISASSLSFLDPLRPLKPLFVSGGILTLGYAFYLLYLKKNPIACACDTDPLRIRMKRRNRILFWVVTGVFIIATIYPYVLARIL